MSFTVYVCPVCGEDVAFDFEQVTGHHHPEYGGWVETIEVEAVPDPAQLCGRRYLALFRLREDRREADFRLAERRWYENLSVADRFWEDERRKRVRREELQLATPLDRVVMEMQDGWADGLVRQLYSDRPLLMMLDPRWQDG